MSWNNRELRPKPSTTSSLRTRVDSNVTLEWERKDDLPPVPRLPPGIKAINHAIDAEFSSPDTTPTRGDIEGGGVVILDSIDGQVDEVALEKSHQGDPWLVTWVPGETQNPKNWSRGYRWLLTALAGIYVLNATFASSAPSGITQPTIAEFHLSDEVALLPISLFVLGYAVGPILWGPLSEIYGRRPIFISTFIVYTGFQVGSALAQNTASVLIFRFLGGTFASSPQTNSGALIGDIWDSKTRGKAMAAFCLAPFAGPSLGPLVAGYITTAHASWRWLYWTLTAFAGVCLISILFLVPETYEPILLRRKAERLRKETNDQRFYAAVERQPQISIFQRVQQVLFKPFVLGFTEPMLLAINLYMSFIFGCMYLEFEAYPIVFSEGHGFNAGQTGLAFLPILVGATLGVIINLLFFEPQYQRKAEELKPKPVPPEQRLISVIWMGIPYVISFFWFGWTSFPSVSFWAPLMSGVFMGAGFCSLFLGLVNYTVDAYISVSASALAIQTILRSLAGAGFPLFAIPMYNKLGPQWASSLLGFLALLMMPMSIVLYKIGPRLRKNSKYSPS